MARSRDRASGGANARENRPVELIDADRNTRPRREIRLEPDRSMPGPAGH